MGDEGAAAALVAAMMAALKGVPGLSSVSDGVPIQAGDSHALIEAGPETDWGHKSGEGAEVRVAVLIRCGGEQPARARMLAQAAREKIAAVGPVLGGSTGSGEAAWRLVTMTMIRSRTVPLAAQRPGSGWTGIVEYRARLLKE